MCTEACRIGNVDNSRCRCHGCRGEGRHNFSGCWEIVPPYGTCPVTAGFNQADGID